MIDPNKKKLICCATAVAMKAMHFGEVALINEESIPDSYPIEKRIEQLEKAAAKLEQMAEEVAP